MVRILKKWSHMVEMYRKVHDKYYTIISSVCSNKILQKIWGSSHISVRLNGFCHILCSAPDHPYMLKSETQYHSLLLYVTYLQ